MGGWVSPLLAVDHISLGRSGARAGRRGYKGRYAQEGKATEFRREKPTWKIMTHLTWA